MATKKASTAPFSAEERAAMREAAKEQKAALKGAEALQQLLDKVAEMPDQDREIAEKLHALIERVAPELAGKTWYGMPAYTLDGKTICFFQAADKVQVPLRHPRLSGGCRLGRRRHLGDLVRHPGLDAGRRGAGDRAVASGVGQGLRKG